MKKSEARTKYKELRAALTQRELNVKQDLLLIKFQEIALPYAQIVHTYIPKYANNEPDPGPLVDWMRFRDLGLKLSYSKINTPDFSMQHFLDEDEMVFQENSFGISEPVGGVEISPEMIDIAFVPLLAFDIEGNRVGYGKGYYDRFLEKCRKDIITIGLSYFPPLDKVDDIDFFDKKIDFCITPECVYAF